MPKTGKKNRQPASDKVDPIPPKTKEKSNPVGKKRRVKSKKQSPGLGQGAATVHQNDHQGGTDNTEGSGVTSGGTPRHPDKTAATTGHGANEPGKSSNVRDQPRGRSRGRSDSNHRARSHPRSRYHSRSRSRSRRRSRSRSRSRRRSRSHSHRRSPAPQPSHNPSDSRSGAPTQSPPRHTAQQKGKQVQRTHFPSTPHPKEVTGSSRYRDRPGPSSLARPRAVQESSSEDTDDEQLEEASEQVRTTDDASFWRHVGKGYAIRHESWLSRSNLRCACRCQSPEDSESQAMRILVEQLDYAVIKPDLRITKRFQSEFLRGMRQLRSELVHAMDNHSLEILGIDGRQVDYREGRIDKATHPGFCHLRDNNRFLGTGKQYLCSDQIVRGLRLALAGPKSIETVHWTAHSRANIHNISTVPDGLLLLVSTILYFLVMPQSRFDGFIRGKGALFTDFWEHRLQDLSRFSQSRHKALVKYLDEQVFGAVVDDDEEEYERQKAFSEAKWQELEASGGSDGDGSEDQEGGDVEKGGQDAGNRVEDNGQDASHGK